MKTLVIAALVAFGVGCGKSSTPAHKTLTSPITGQSVLTPSTTTPVTGDIEVVDLLKVAGVGNGNGTFTGSVDGGNTLTPAAAFYDVLGDANGTFFVTFIAIASDANFCTALVQDHNQIKNSAHAVLVVETTDASGQDFLATDISKSFNISSSQNPAGNLGLLDYLPFDQVCSFSQNATDLQAGSGSINVTKLDTSSIVGSFNATVGTQADAVSGTFNAVACPGLAFVEAGAGAGSFVPGCQ